MNNDSNKNIIFLEKFFKKNKEYDLKIKQPIQLKNYDIFVEEEKVEKRKRNSVQKLRAVKNSYGAIQRKYNIVKESTIFQELDTKKNFHLLTNLKYQYKNYLYNTAIKNNNLNNSNSAINTNINNIVSRNGNTFTQKNSLNKTEQYEKKLKNVSG